MNELHLLFSHFTLFKSLFICCRYAAMLKVCTYSHAVRLWWIKRLPGRDSYHTGRGKEYGCDCDKWDQQQGERWYKYDGNFFTYYILESTAGAFFSFSSSYYYDATLAGSLAVQLFVVEISFITIFFFISSFYPFYPFRVLLLVWFVCMYVYHISIIGRQEYIPCLLLLLNVLNIFILHSGIYTNL